MSDTQYAKALKLGEKSSKAATERGESPYLPALDLILKEEDIQSQIPVGLMDIPLNQIAGTRTEGRQNCFAPNFMPLLAENSEFAAKWSSLIRYQQEEGIKDPIIAYEYLDRYYVLEGNKRVSVFKYLGAYSIEGNVTRIVPKRTADPKTRIVYEYMEFFKRTAINYIWFSKEGSFPRLVRLCGKKPDEMWSDEDRREFSSAYLRFSKQLTEKYKFLKDKDDSHIITSDAFLLYLQVYGYEDLSDLPEADLKTRIASLSTEMPVLDGKPEEALVYSPEETEGGINPLKKIAPVAGMIPRILTGVPEKPLNIAFIHDRPLGNSGWVYTHELGRMHVQQVFNDRIHTCSYFLESSADTAYNVIEAAIADHNQVVFVTGEAFVDDSLKAALAYPKVKILNCSLNRPSGALRTYYGRIYEARFLEGIIAGALTENDRAAYFADFPIYGSIAGINAFALGASMVNPDFRVYLYWNRLADHREEEREAFLREHKLSIISDTDFPRLSEKNRRYGLHGIISGRDGNLAAPIWNWGKFYEKIVRDILTGSWKEAKKGRKAINYWWGLSGDMIDLILSSRLPASLRRLCGVMRGQIADGHLHPFEGPVIRQDGTCACEEGHVLSAEEIITMDWLCNNVIGSIPPAFAFQKEYWPLLSKQGIVLPEEES